MPMVPVWSMSMTVPMRSTMRVSTARSMVRVSMTMVLMVRRTVAVHMEVPVMVVGFFVVWWTMQVKVLRVRSMVVPAWSMAVSA